MRPYNPNFLPKGYFSKQSVPYWCLVALDCITLVLSGVVSLYVFLGAAGVVVKFWDSLCLWTLSLPVFLLSMHLFRTYVGTLMDSPFANFMRLACALFTGGVALRLMLALLPQSMVDYNPGTVIIFFAILISLLVQWSYRMVAKSMFMAHEEELIDNPFFKGLQVGMYNDTTVRAQQRVNLCLAHMSEEGLELKYVKEAFDTNWVVPLGPNVNAFEQDLENFFGQGLPASEGKPRVVALSSGTGAVHLALRACGVLPGDEVIVQSFTFCASANPVAYVGAFPVFVDSEPQTWNMDPDLLEQAILDRIRVKGRKPRAIIPVALYGMPYQVDRILAVARKYDILVIEDAAEGFGSEWRGRLLGTFGRYGVLSFNGNKMITTSGGGALLCNGVPSAAGSQPAGDKQASASGHTSATGSQSAGSQQASSSSQQAQDAPHYEPGQSPDEQRKNVLWFATQARESFPYYQHEAIGYNYRLSNVCAGIGRGQMTVAADHIAHHRHVQALYEELLADVPGLHMHRQPTNAELGLKGEKAPVCQSNYWLCAFTLDADVHVEGQEQAYQQAITAPVGGAAGVLHVSGTTQTDCQPNANVEALRLYLEKHQIESRPLWKPMHRQPVYRDAVAYVNGVSESIFRQGLCIPAGPCVSDMDVYAIVHCIREAILG